MPPRIQIRRSVTNQPPPSGSLLEGELAIELAQTGTPRLWVGCSAAVHADQQRVVNPPSSFTFDDILGTGRILYAYSTTEIRTAVWAFIDITGGIVNDYKNSINAERAPFFRMLRGRGSSHGTVFAVNNLDVLGDLLFAGWRQVGPSLSTDSVRLRARTTQHWTGGAAGARFTISVVPNNSLTLANRFGIGQAGGVIVGDDDAVPDPGANNLTVAGNIAVWNGANVIGPVNVSGVTTINRSGGPVQDYAASLHVIGPDGGGPNRVVIDSFGGNPAVTMRRTQGSSTNIQPVTLDAVIGQVQFTGCAVAGEMMLGAAAWIRASAIENWDAYGQGARIEFSTVGIRDVTLTPRMMLGQGLIVGGGIDLDRGPGTITCAHLRASDGANPAVEIRRTTLADNAGGLWRVNVGAVGACNIQHWDGNAWQVRMSVRTDGRVDITGQLWVNGTHYAG